MLLTRATAHPCTALDNCYANQYSGYSNFDKQQQCDNLKAAVFQQYPIEGFENEKTAWGDCVRAIDEAGRKLKD